ncbi:GumC family protein [Polaribacter sp. Hel1_85]|uniref:GumC family protein n=1 Tax=Polaribacter sp. Hel1_85 TaxID=1250005 RepID=UPI00052D2EFB|nr:polysaccharide biosynthesis tyrosine autokinase [Polaribacter sp. Hel1_85]KGL64343.1 tyrosine-protein kinase Wzc [Polaribacter sp. Hel1_85]
MQEQQQNFTSKIVENNDTIDIRAELGKYLVHWKWFVIGGMLSMVLAFIYLRYKTPLYNASTSIMIKDNKKSGISAELASFSDLGIIGGGSSNNTDNEIEILTSRKIIGNVVDSLSLTSSYFLEGRIKKSEAYNKTPLFLEFIKKDALFTEKDTVFVVSILDKNKIEFKSIDGEFILSSSFNEVINSEIGQFKITNSKENNEIFRGKDVFINIKGRNKVIDSYTGRISVNPANKNSSVLKISLQDAVKSKSEDILNELVKQYNIDAIKDKNIVSEKTKDFIEDRLKSVGADLAAVQDDVKNYKTKFGISGLSSEGELALQEVSFNNKKIVEIQSQLSLANWIQKKLKKESEANDVLPTNLGFTDVSISSSIESYNELVLKKNKLLVTAGSKNPQLIEVQSQITTLNRNLLSSLDNLKKSLEIQLYQLNIEGNKVTSKIVNIPLIERGMIDIERQREIYSELFSYLLKKKEETAISLAVTVPNAKIIDVAYGSSIPVSPKRKIVYLAALILGLLIPFIIIYLKNLLDTKIHSRKDIEDLTTLPFIGDVPHSETNDKIVIGNDSRTSTAEAFRLIRTNLDFMLPNNDNDLGKTIFITSTTSGEGKSFISINLAAALSLSNKKVLLLGMDLRAPKVTEYLGISERKGITNFITNDNISLDDVKFTIPEIKGLDIISSGVIPPNPAELLLSAKVKELFDEVKKDYDFIIVDTAPVNLVTDTLLVAKYANMFMYVTRANYLDKRMLNIPQTLYNEKKLPNMAIVLNDTDMKKGYGYGYGYGYGNGYIEQVKKPWYKRILS